MKILDLLTPKRLIGNAGEKAAAKFLKKTGYKIIKQNFVADGHEIDIIASDKENICFVEVKSRTIGKEDPKEPRPACAVTREKQRSIISAARVYIGFYRPEKHVRFDIVEVYLNDRTKAEKIVHMENAFNADTAYHS